MSKSCVTLNQAKSSKMNLKFLKLLNAKCRAYCLCNKAFPLCRPTNLCQDFIWHNHWITFECLLWALHCFSKNGKTSDQKKGFKHFFALYSRANPRFWTKRKRVRVWTLLLLKKFASDPRETQIVLQFWTVLYSDDNVGNICIWILVPPVGHCNSLYMDSGKRQYWCSSQKDPITLFLCPSASKCAISQKILWFISCQELPVSGCIPENQSFFCSFQISETSHIKVCILKTPRYRNSGIRPCITISIEQLIKITRERKYDRIKPEVVGTVPRGWSSDYGTGWDTCVGYPV